jgi:hypothetical protein
MPPDLPESLAICASLVHMHQPRTPASNAYIWKTISAEGQRLYSEVCATFHAYPPLEDLSSLQVISIAALLHPFLNLVTIVFHYL